MPKNWITSKVWRNKPKSNRVLKANRKIYLLKKPPGKPLIITRWQMQVSDFVKS